MTTGSRVPVLDKGFVRLVGHHGDDLLVVNAARVSFAKESTEFTDKDANLIRFLARGCTTKDFDALVESLVDTGDREAIKEALWQFRDTPLHFTAFGHPQITLHFKWPLMVARQAMRSNIGICWNEVSRRYVDDTPEFYEPEVWRGRPEGSIKQGSADKVLLEPYIHTCLSEVRFETRCLYENLLKQGVAPEMARMVLPQSTYTECWGTFSLAALARFYKLRSDSHAQLEIQQYAAAIDALVRPLFPCSWSALTGS